MDTGEILSTLETFDPELYGALQKSVENQRYELSLLPTANAISPFMAFLKGSVLGNEYTDHHAAEEKRWIERLASKRACELFGAEHAVVRLTNLAAASRVVFYALAEQGNTVLSFNGRKQEHTAGEWLSFQFESFGIDDKTQRIDLDQLAEQAKRCHPRLLIFSPVNYPRQMDYEALARIAHENGAKLWVDMGQNAGLVAGKAMRSPVPYADVVTFAANDSLRGPQRAVILCKQDIAEKLEQVVVNTGHVDIKGNTLIALALNFREAATRRYQAYCQQVLKNAQAMEQGIMKAGVETLCGATESHLVLPRLQEGQNAGEMADLFWHGGILVKPDLMPTQHGTREYPILRISSLCPTTRGFHEAEMEKVGHLVGNFLLAGADVQQDVKKEIGRLIMDKPVFSSEWLPEAEPQQNATTQDAIAAPHKAEASLKHRFMEQILHLGGR